MNKDSLIYVEHILERVETILEYTRGMTQNEFLTNRLVQDAVIRNLEVIGEATKRLPIPFREKHPSVPWRQMAGMRDRLIHDYIGVDMWAVWGVIDDVLPVYPALLRSIMEQESSENS